MITVRGWVCAVLAAALLCGWAGPAAAQGATVGADGGVTLPADVDEALGRLEKAADELERVRTAGGDAAPARGRLEAAERDVEAARVAALARASGRSEDEVRAMRASGKGWGVIAKETGVPPGSLGLGHGAAPRDGRGDGQGRASGAPKAKAKEKSTAKEKSQKKSTAKTKDKAKNADGADTGGK